MRRIVFLSLLLLPVEFTHAAARTTIQQFGIDTVGFINTTLLPLLIAIAFGSFVYQAVRYFIIGATNPTSQEAAKVYMIYSVGAFVLIASIWGVINLFVGGLGFTRSEVVCPDFLPASYCRSGNAPSFNSYSGGGAGNTNQYNTGSGQTGGGSGNGGGATAAQQQPKTPATTRDASPRIGDSAAGVEVHACLSDGSVFMTLIHGITIDTNPATTTISALERYATLYSPEYGGVNSEQLDCSPLLEICYENLTVTVPNDAWTAFNGTQIPDEPFYSTTTTSYNTSVISLAESIKRAALELCY